MTILHSNSRSNRGEGANELIESTRITLKAYMKMNEEGLIPTPRVLLLLG